MDRRRSLSRSQADVASKTAPVDQLTVLTLLTETAVLALSRADTAGDDLGEQLHPEDVAGGHRDLPGEVDAGE